MSEFSNWEQIDDGKWNGVKKFIRSSEEDHGTVQVRYEGHDVPLIVAQNKQDQNDHSGKLGDGLHHAARIPASILMQWIQQDGHQAVYMDPQYLAKKLNDPDYKWLKRLPITI